MQYILLLRGVNMMGKNTLVMSDFVKNLNGIGLSDVRHYINSGNIIFKSDGDIDKLYLMIQGVLKDKHHLPVDFLIIRADDFQNELDNLPHFWQDNDLKKSVLFFMRDFDVNGFKQLLGNTQLDDEYLYIGKTAMFWAGNPEKSVYRHHFIKPKILQSLSIRNENTVKALAELLKN